jgi:hypothetical protein
MRFSIPTSALLLVAWLAACHDSAGPTDPLESERTPAFAATQGSFSLPIDLVGLVFFAGCANDGVGEPLEYVSGVFDTYWSWTETPSGNELWNVLSDYDTGDPLTAVGLISGDVWILERGEGNSNFVHKAAAPKKVNDHFQAHEWYVNQDGEKLHLQQRFTRQRDLDGNIKNSTFAENIRCN